MYRQIVYSSEELTELLRQAELVGATVKVTHSKREGHGIICEVEAP